MAEGGEVPGSKAQPESNSNDECMLPCCVCIKNNIKTEADKYCTICLNYYCQKCVKLHDVVPALTGHAIVSKGEASQKIFGANVPSIPTKRCDEHDAKIVDMFCKTHGEVGCTTCITIKHSQ